ncbi:MAG: ABC transporter permease [Lachnospira sp.]|nr:ABC transporter permease [Lachnospira sp.]
MKIFFNDIITSMKRRRKEMRLILAIVFIATFFMNGIVLFQKNAETYTFEYNKNVYGEWSVAEVYEDETTANLLSKYAYFDSYGTCLSGLELYSNEEVSAGAKLGYMDEEFIRIGHIKLSSGAFPKNNDEIVLDSSTLVELGYTRKLGQNIEVKFKDGEGNFIAKTYKLVGVMKTNTCNWIIGDSMPRGILTQEEIESIDFDGTISYCYHMAKEYEKADVKEIEHKLYKAHSPSARNGEKFVYNSPLYNVTIWGSSEVYSVIEVMTLLAGVIAMSFLMISYIQKRKRYYYNYRTIGMSKAQVRSMILIESGYIFIPTQLVAIISSIVTAILISGIITLVNGYKYFFELPIINMLKMILAGILLYIVSTIIALVVNSKNTLHGNQQEISTRFLFRWRMNKLRHRQINRSLFKREQKVFAVRNAFSILIVMTFTVMLLIAVNKLWEEYREYSYYFEEVDVTGVRPQDTVKGGEYVYYGPDDQLKLSLGGQNRKRKSLSYGYSEGFFEGLKDIKGIKSYEFLTFDNMHLFEWDNMEEDEYITSFRNTVIGSGSVSIGKPIEKVEWTARWDDVLEEKNQLEYGYSSCFVYDVESAYKKVAGKYSSEYMDYDKFKSGEQVFIVMNSKFDSYVKAGSEIRIIVGDEKVAVQVATIIPRDRLPEGSLPKYITADTYGNKMILVASKELGEKIASMEGGELEYNHISIQLKQTAQYASYGGMCANLIVADGGVCDDWYTYYAEQIDKHRNKMMVYISFMLMLTAFFVIIRINIVQSAFAFNSNRIRRLRLLGMSKKRIKMMNIHQALNEVKWIVLTIPAVFVYRMQLLYIEYKDNGKYHYPGVTNYHFWVEELETYVRDVKDILKYCWERWINVRWMVIIVIIMIVINVIIRYISISQHLRELDKEGFC